MSLQETKDGKHYSQCCDPYKRGCKSRSPSKYDRKDFLSVWSVIEQLGWQRSTHDGNWTCPQCIKGRLPLKPENIVILQYSNNTCYVQICEIGDKQPGLEIDVENGMWMNGNGKAFPIGSGYKGNGRVIGVFDRTDFRHLQILISQASEATRGPNSSID